MADNVLLNAGVGGDTIAADDIGGVKYQIVKVAVGADGAASLVSNSNPVPVSDAGGSITVDGTVELGATSLAALESITVSGGSITVDGTVELGATSLAALENISATVSDGGGSITVDGTVELGSTTLAALETIELGATSLAALESLTTITTVSTVTAVTAITNALPAGTNNIGDVDVLSIVPGTGATNLGKAEDAAHTSADVGVMALAVRRDADTTLVDATGDYAPLQVNAAGSLKVAITSGAGSGGTSIADGASFTRDATSVTLAAAAVETSAPTLTNGDAAALSMTTGGALRVAVASGGIAGVIEDAASAGGEEGIMILAVRRDSASSGVSADGDFACLSVDSSGNLRTTGSSGITSYTEDAASAGAESLVLMGAVRRDTAASSSGTDGDYSTLNTDANGRLHVIAALAATQTLATVTNVATIGTSVTPGTSAAHLGKAEDAAHASGDTGVMSLGVRSDTAAASSGTTGDYEPFHTDSVGAMWTRSTGELADDAPFTPGTSRVMPIGLQADETATDSVDEGDVGAPRMTLDRKQIVSAYAHAAGGATPGRLVSAASTNGTVVKASAGTLYALVVTNLNAAVRYLKVYNSTSVTVGTTTPTWTFAIPASTTGAGFNVPIPACGIAFGTGICLGMTTGIADNDTGAVAANEIIANYAYV